MDKELRKEAINNYKSGILASWILGVSLAVFAASIIAIGLISEFLMYPLIVLLLFPFFFSCIVSHLAIKRNETITFTNQFSRSLLFFRNGNYRSFRIIVAFLLSFLIYAVISIFGTFVAIIVFRNNNSDAFNEIYQSLLDVFYSGEDTTFNEVLTSYQDVILLYELFVVAPASLIATTYFIYRTTLNAIYVYAKNFLHRFQILLVISIHNLVFKTYGRNIRKDYLSLNWPMFVIFPIFAIGMGTITYLFIRQEIQTVIILGIIGGFLSLMFFLPFYFGNMEALFNKYMPEYKRCTVEIINGLKERQLNQGVIVEESEEQIRNAIDALDNPDDDENLDDNTEDEE